MSQFAINLICVLGSFVIYTWIALWARAKSTRQLYIAGGEVHPVLNGMATAADWLSAASFLSVAGLISVGYVNSSFIMGWTGGYVLLATLLAPYLRRFGTYTVPDFVGKRYASKSARVVAVVCLIIVSLTYVIGQMTGAGVAFRSEEHTSELQSRENLVCRLLLDLTRPPRSTLFPYTTLFRSGGYVLLATLLAPYLRRFGTYTVPDFVGKRYASKSARVVAVVCLIIVSLTYVIGQMTGAGVAF